MKYKLNIPFKYLAGNQLLYHIAEQQKKTETGDDGNRVETETDWWDLLFCCVKYNEIIAVHVQAELRGIDKNEMVTQVMEIPSEEAKEVLLTSTVNTVNIDAHRYRFWYFHKNYLDKEGDKDIKDVINSMWEVIKDKVKSPQKYSDYMEEGDVGMVALDRDMFQAMFDTPGSGVLKNNLNTVLADYGIADGESEVDWDPVDTPDSYMELIKLFSKAEVLKVMSQQIPVTSVTLPFIYTGIPQGFPIVFCRLGDLFYGMVNTVSISGDNDSGFSTTISIGSIVSVKHALRLSSIKGKEVFENRGMTLGFDFIQPIKGEMFNRKLLFDWRNCVKLKKEKLKDPAGLKDGKGYVELRTLVPPPPKQTKGEETEKLMDKYSDIIEYVTEWVTGDIPYREAEDNDPDSKGIKKFFSDMAHTSDMSQYMVFDEDLYLNEMYRVARERMYYDIERNLGSPQVQELLKKIDKNRENVRKYKNVMLEKFGHVEALSEHWDKFMEKGLTYETDGDWDSRDLYVEIMAVIDSGMVDTTKEIRGVKEEILKINAEVEEYKKAIRTLISLLIPFRFTETPDKYLGLFKNIIPICNGLQEADELSYKKRLSPWQIFSDRKPATDKVVYKDDPNSLFEPASITPLSTNDIKTSHSAIEVAKSISRFIAAVRENVLPYIANTEISFKDTIKDIEEE